MAAAIRKVDDLRENLKIAEYLLRETELKASTPWLEERTEEQEAIIVAATKRKADLVHEHARAKVEVANRLAYVKQAKQALAEWVNRGTIADAETRESKLADLIAKARKQGYSDEDIKAALGG